MAINTTTPIIKFLIPDLHSQYDIGIADASFYPVAYTITDPTVEITPPGFPKVALAYSPGQLTSFNSNDLNITCVGDPTQLTVLPDGMWTVRMSIAPNLSFNSSLSYIRTTNIRKRFGLALMKTDLTCCTGQMGSQQKAYLDEIDYYIQCATAAGNDCNPTVAMELLRTANKLLNDFLEDRPNHFLNPGYYLAGL
jgi:hypothetical protein